MNILIYLINGSRKNSSSQYIGVHWNNLNNKWVSSIRIGKEIKHLGYFKSEEEAAKIRDIHTKKIFGEFGKLNFED